MSQPKQHDMWAILLSKGGKVHTVAGPFKSKSDAASWEKENREMFADSVKETILMRGGRL